MRKAFCTVISVALALCTVVMHGCTNAEKKVNNIKLEVYSKSGEANRYSVPEEFDPFYGLQVSFSGEADRGFAEFNTDDCYEFVKDNFTFECENNGRLTNGSKAVIKAKYDEKTFTDGLFTLSCKEKAYTVTGVKFYPPELEGYDKNKLVKAVWNVAGKYIEDNIKDIEMEYESTLDHNDWDKSGSFKFTYNYSDMRMIYNVNKKDTSQNAFFIIYELSNSIECTENMQFSDGDIMTAGESDTGWAYVVVGVSSVKATSDKEFCDDVKYESVKKNIKTFTTLEDAREYCRYGGEYRTMYENFV